MQGDSKTEQEIINMNYNISSTVNFMDPHNGSTIADSNKNLNGQQLLSTVFKAVGNNILQLLNLNSKATDNDIIMTLLQKGINKANYESDSMLCNVNPLCDGISVKADFGEKLVHFIGNIFQITEYEFNNQNNNNDNNNGYNRTSTPYVVTNSNDDDNYNNNGHFQTTTENMATISNGDDNGDNNDNDNDYSNGDIDTNGNFQTIFQNNDKFKEFTDFLLQIGHVILNDFLSSEYENKYNFMVEVLNKLLNVVQDDNLDWENVNISNKRLNSKKILNKLISFLGGNLVSNTEKNNVYVKPYKTVHTPKNKPVNRPDVKTISKKDNQNMPTNRKLKKRPLREYIPMYPKILSLLTKLI